MPLCRGEGSLGPVALHPLYLPVPTEQVKGAKPVGAMESVQRFVDPREPPIVSYGEPGTPPGSGCGGWLGRIVSLEPPLSPHRSGEQPPEEDEGLSALSPSRALGATSACPCRSINLLQQHSQSGTSTHPSSWSHRISLAVPQASS